MFLLDRLRKKQPGQEGREEPYFPPDLERFRVREEPVPPIASFDMPENERKFRAFAREMESKETPERRFIYQPGGSAAMDLGEERKEAVDDRVFKKKTADDADKLDMVLQKLETIDLRLKLIEQKIERRPI